MRLLPLFVMVVLAGAGCGGGSHPTAKEMGMSSSTTATAAAAGRRTVDVEMRDIAYSPSTISVHTGETVTFVFHNMGRTQHEAFIGDSAAQADHERMMGNGGPAGEMGGMGGAAEEVKVEPGRTGSLSHTFQPGEALLIGCHEPGHYAAGMKAALAVS
jgi:uncharacterized cupredoxin-like copper-binding protein